MKIEGEYTLEYTIYTMFNVYSMNIKHHNLITNKGFEFFMRKWFTDNDNDYPLVFGFYHDNKFYRSIDIYDEYIDELKVDGIYSTTTNYVDRKTNKQYMFDGENFVTFAEKLEKICIGNCAFSIGLTADKSDTKLYSNEKDYLIEDFVMNPTSLVMKLNIENDDLNGTTEIGVKTNHGRLVSHDIHPPYNLPFGTNVTLEYVFKLQ